MGGAGASGALLQAGALLTAVLLLRMTVRHRTSIEQVPTALRARVAAADRHQPWLLAVGLVTTAAGLVLTVV